MSDRAAPSSFVIGTAGHIDHGKSTLVKALTGTDPDRLAEEKSRGMTIELGFANLTTPGGRSIGIVDVPGHERFIKTMLAGVGGIDAALLIVAADEGPMPQTLEHLAILDLLRIDVGIVVMTKCDLVDRDWLDLVIEETREQLIDTSLADAPIMPVSAATADGLPELVRELDTLLAATRARGAGSKPRLPIDRVFTVAGFGTVVTGTLTGRALTVGQSLVVMPGGLNARIRGLQTHSRSVEQAEPGNRVAVNLAGLAVDELNRGDVLSVPGALRPTHRLDARIRLLSDSPIALEQNTRVELFIGAAEAAASVTLLDAERIAPGDSGWVQLRFQRPLAVSKGDRFIIRRPSPSATIGGGEVIDANPVRHRRFRPDVLSSLETLAAGSPDELVLHALEHGPLALEALRAALPDALSAEQLDEAVEQLLAEGDARRVGALLVATSTWDAFLAETSRLLEGFHAAHPLRPGMPRQELRARIALSLSPKGFDHLIAAAVDSGALADSGATIRLKTFTIELDAARRAAAERYLAAIRAMPYAPPAPAEFGVDAESLAALTELGEVVKIADGVYYEPSTFDAIVRMVLDMIDRAGSITMADYRDRFQSSRKFAQATLEHLDQQRITRRIGDERVRFTAAGSRRADGGNG